MSSKNSAVSTITLALATAGIAVLVWWWRSTMVRLEPVSVKGEPWTHVQEQYPMPQDISERSKLSPETSETILAANPFSPTRGAVPPSGDGGASSGGGTAPAEPPKPKFTFKGLIKLGSRVRAIVEDATSQKTHFLEVGQEVAGFKVLDIAENQVLLSNLLTSEEVVVALTPKAAP